MRRSTKKAIFVFLFLIILIGAAGYFVMFSGILNRDKYQLLPIADNRNIYNVETKTIEFPLFNTLFDSFASTQLVGKDISEVKIYDRKDNLMNATSDIFVEVHTLNRSIECISHYILTLKVSTGGDWYYKSFIYDSQFTDSYIPFQNLTEDEVKEFLIGQTLNISEKEITVTNDNLLEFSVENKSDDISNKKDVQKIKIKVAADLLVYEGTVNMSFTFLGSSWELESLTVEDFTSDFSENVKPNFTDNDYLNIIIQNPYAIPDQDFSINFAKDKISNITELENSVGGSGEVFTQKISFNVNNDSSQALVTAEIVYDKTSDGWSCRKISYDHEFEDVNLVSAWNGNYSVFVANPELEEFEAEDEKKLTKEEKEEKEKIDKENSRRSSKIKTEVLVSYEFEGTDELGYYVGKTTWNEYGTDKDGNRSVVATYSTGVIGEFDETTLKFNLVFDETIVIGDNKYSSAEFHYDFVNEALTNKLGTFTKQIKKAQESEEEVSEEEESSDTNDSESADSSNKTTDSEDTNSNKKESTDKKDSSDKKDSKDKK